MLCALIVFVNGVTYSLTSIPNDRFFENFFNGNFIQSLYPYANKKELYVNKYIKQTQRASPATNLHVPRIHGGPNCCSLVTNGSKKCAVEYCRRFIAIARGNFPFLMLCQNIKWKHIQRPETRQCRSEHSAVKYYLPRRSATRQIL